MPVGDESQFLHVCLGEVGWLGCSWDSGLTGSRLVSPLGVCGSRPRPGRGLGGQQEAASSLSPAEGVLALPRARRPSTSHPPRRLPLHPCPQLPPELLPRGGGKHDPNPPARALTWLGGLMVPIAARRRGGWTGLIPAGCGPGRPTRLPHPTQLREGLRRAPWGLGAGLACPGSVPHLAWGWDPRGC